MAQYFLHSQHGLKLQMWGSNFGAFQSGHAFTQKPQSEIFDSSRGKEDVQGRHSRAITANHNGERKTGIIVQVHVNKA